MNFLKKTMVAKARPFPKAVNPVRISGKTARKLLAVSIASTTSNGRMK
tara:strand:- start:557 stop:700 length:144 start_codon:yes stop_codon:yes gene_type:complete